MHTIRCAVRKGVPADKATVNTKVLLYGVRMFTDLKGLRVLPPRYLREDLHNGKLWLPELSVGVG
jgi:hypothetical protein